MKAALIATITMILCTSYAAAGAGRGVSASSEQDSVTVTVSELADKLIDEAMVHLGKPYRYGARGPKRFDCSGFTRYVYAAFDIDIGANSTEQSKRGTAVENSVSNLRKGDLLFFSGRRIRKKVGHVGIYIGPDESGEGLKFIHASTSGGVQISNTKEEYYSKRFLCARRVLPDFVEPNDDPTSETTLRDAKAVKWRDALSLGRKDSRVVVMANGEWSYVSDKGKVIKPEKEESLILYPDGTWKTVPVSRITIPTLDTRESEPEEPTATIAEDIPEDPGTEQPEKSSRKKYHTVERGDTLYRIAQKHRTTIDAICRLNKIKTSTILDIGRKLRVK